MSVVVEPEYQEGDVIECTLRYRVTQSLTRAGSLTTHWGYRIGYDGEPVNNRMVTSLPVGRALRTNLISRDPWKCPPPKTMLRDKHDRTWIVGCRGGYIVFVCVDDTDLPTTDRGYIDASRENWDRHEMFVTR